LEVSGIQVPSKSDTNVGRFMLMPGDGVADLPDSCYQDL